MRSLPSIGADDEKRVYGAHPRFGFPGCFYQHGEVPNYARPMRKLNYLLRECMTI